MAVSRLLGALLYDTNSCFSRETNFSFSRETNFSFSRENNFSFSRENNSSFSRISKFWKLYCIVIVSSSGVKPSDHACHHCWRCGWWRSNLPPHWGTNFHHVGAGEPFLRGRAGTKPLFALSLSHRVQQEPEGTITCMELVGKGITILQVL